jgi:hypothetical protein
MLDHRNILLCTFHGNLVKKEIRTETLGKNNTISEYETSLIYETDRQKI